MSFEFFLIYSVTVFVASFIPGPSMLLALTHGMKYGAKKTIASALGNLSITLIQAAISIAGLGAILIASESLFNIIKWAGAGYLIWIGIDFLRSREHNDQVENVEEEQLGTLTIYRQGVLTNVLNPKVSLFFLSFLPQFVDPQAEFIFTPFVVLGLIFFTTGSIWCTVLVFGSTWLTDKVQNRASVGGILKKLTGTLFVVLGVKLAFSHAQ